MTLADLDRVIEALELGELAARALDATADETKISDALTLLRQMRENAVEVGVDAEMGPAGFEKPDVYFLARTFNKEEDVRALLILTPEDE